MYNLCLREFHQAVVLVAQIHQGTEALERGATDFTHDKVLEVHDKLLALKDMFDRASMPSASARLAWTLGRLQMMLRGEFAGSGLAQIRSDTQSLHEAIIDDAAAVHVYCYPIDRVKLIKGIDEQWGVAMSAFPSAADEIKAAVDLYGTGHHTAAVFHLMRAVEVALRALARERKVKLKKSKPIDSGQWQELISAISNEVRAIGLNWKMGKRKERALAFYSSALSHMTGFKDKYRNQVSHSVRSYDEHEAASALLHVREFMNTLGERLDENSKRSIAWGR